MKNVEERHRGYETQFCSGSTMDAFMCVGYYSQTEIIACIKIENYTMGLGHWVIPFKILPRTSVHEKHGHFCSLMNLLS
uniref:Uncharacterized protein n=1 Tax=Anguilla anguilla TaxID=7936 RepID=A0A0E9PXA4_ANGAN